MSGRAATEAIIPGRAALSVGDPQTIPPKGWCWTPLLDVAELGTGHTPSRQHPEYWGGDIGWIGIRDARAHNGDTIYHTLQTVTPDGLDNSAARLLPEGTVCLSRTASVGYVTMMGTDMATSQDFVAWTCGEALDPVFLMKAIQAEGEDIRRFGKGTTHTTIYFPEVKAFHVCLPPLPEQRRIVAKLDRLSARSAAAREHLARTQTLAARAKQATLAAAFRGDLTAEWRMHQIGPSAGGNEVGIDSRVRLDAPLPPEWAWASLKEASFVSGGLTKNAKRTAMLRRLPYLRVANVYADELRLDDVSEIGCTDKEGDRTALREGDLLVVEGNGSRDQIGRVAMWRGELPICLHQNHLIRVRCRDGWEPRYCLLWMLSPQGREAIEAVASSSSGLHTLSISKVSSLPVPVCSLKEQQEIVRRIEAAFARIDRLAAEAARAAHLLGRLDERLLARAFRGELVPQDPADEPAEALLARIREARAAAPKPRRSRRRRVP